MLSTTSSLRLAWKSSPTLTKTPRQLGHHANRDLPRLPHFENAGLPLAKRLKAQRFNLGAEILEATLYDGRLPSRADIPLINIPGWFNRPVILRDGDGDYPDNSHWFALFNRTVAQLFAVASSRRNANQQRVLEWQADLTAQ